MRKYLLATLSVAALGFANQAVLAADAVADPVAYDWSGPYIGVQAGYGFGDTNHETNEFDLDGWAGGATVGWNHQLDNLVLGLEGDISAANIEGRAIGCLTRCISEVDWLGTARLRAGFAMESLLLFAAGGLAVGGLEAGNAGGAFHGDDTKIGWTIGAGAEWAATDNLSFKVEYLFVDLGSMDYVGPVDVVNTDFDETHIIRAGLNWHF